MGGRARKKYWQRIEDSNGQSQRYTRCLVITIDGVEYIVDVTNENSDRIFRKYQDEPIIPFSKMSRNWDDDPYDGR